MCRHSLGAFLQDSIKSLSVVLVPLSKVRLTFLKENTEISLVQCAGLGLDQHV